MVWRHSLIVECFPQVGQAIGAVHIEFRKYDGRLLM